MGSKSRAFLEAHQAELVQQAAREGIKLVEVDYPSGYLDADDTQVIDTSVIETQERLRKASENILFLDGEITIGVLSER